MLQELSSGNFLLVMLLHMLSNNGMAQHRGPQVCTMTAESAHCASECVSRCVACPQHITKGSRRLEQVLTLVSASACATATYPRPLPSSPCPSSDPLSDSQYQSWLKLLTLQVQTVGLLQLLDSWWQ